MRSNGRVSAPNDSDAARDKVENAFEDQPSPTLMPLCSSDSSDDRQDTVHQHVSSKQQDKCEQCSAGHEQRNDAENDCNNTAQGDYPPILRQEVAHRVIAG